MSQDPDPEGGDVATSRESYKLGGRDTSFRNAAGETVFFKSPSVSRATHLPAKRLVPGLAPGIALLRNPRALAVGADAIAAVDQLVLVALEEASGKLRVAREGIVVSCFISCRSKALGH